MQGSLTIAGVAVAPLAWYAFVMGMTPGPNNLMLAASGMNFGWRRTVPHMAGVFFGFAGLMFLAGIGIGALYERAPMIQGALRILGSLALVYLAWRIAGASRIEHPADARPLRFIEAAFFQFANPKGLVFAISAASGFLGEAGVAGAVVLAITGMAMTLLSTTTWTLFGTALTVWMQSERAQKRVNLLFAAALLATVPLILLD